MHTNGMTIERMFIDGVEMHVDDFRNIQDEDLIEALSGAMKFGKTVTASIFISEIGAESPEGIFVVHPPMRNVTPKQKLLEDWSV